MNKEKEIIIDITDAKNLDNINIARELGINKVISRKGFLDSVSINGFTKLVVSDNELGDEKIETVPWVEINDAEDISKAIDESEFKDKVVVECKDWMVIPLENLIAEFSKRGKKIYAFINNAKSIGLALTILEKGVDGVVIPIELLPDARDKIYSILSEGTVRLSKARIIDVKDAGLGDRVCVDTTSNLQMGEGLLVGSKSSFFFLVHSETIPTKYIPTRQFRINAGAVHSYVLNPDGKTNYLSELKAGDRVKIVSVGGSSRVVTVGRVKIERRPLLIISARVADEEGSIILQNAETVRLVRSNLEPVSVTDVKEGEEVLVHIGNKSGRHFGVEIDEYIIER